MGYSRKENENCKELVQSGVKKYVRYDEGTQLFSMGLTTFKKVAKEAGAVIKVHRITLVNVQLIENYLDRKITIRGRDS